MAFITCRQCRREISNKCDACRHCGETIDAPQPLGVLGNASRSKRNPSISRGMSKSDIEGALGLLFGIPFIAFLLWMKFGSESEPMMSKKAEYRTLEACLTGLHAETGEMLVPTIDDPDMVSGRLANGTMWWCKKCQSGTRGTYWEARY
jgi:hypothetical protein